MGILPKSTIFIMKIVQAFSLIIFILCLNLSKIGPQNVAAEENTHMANLENGSHQTAQETSGYRHLRLPRSSSEWYYDFNDNDEAYSGVQMDKEIPKFVDKIKDLKKKKNKECKKDWDSNKCFVAQQRYDIAFGELSKWANSNLKCVEVKARGIKSCPKKRTKLSRKKHKKCSKKLDKKCGKSAEDIVPKYMRKKIHFNY